LRNARLLFYRDGRRDASWLARTPGARLPTRLARSRQLSLVGARCGHHAEAVEVGGQLWSEAINGHGLEAVTPHIHFPYRAGG
jgi:hypothetical protein